MLLTSHAMPAWACSHAKQLLLRLRLQSYTHKHTDTHKWPLAVGWIQGCSQQHAMGSKRYILQHFLGNILIWQIYFSESITGKYEQNNTSRAECWKPALLWEQLCLRYYQSQIQVLPTTSWSLIFEAVERDSSSAIHGCSRQPWKLQPRHHAEHSSYRYPTIHLPTHHCVWATCAFLWAEMPHSIWLSECLFHLVETIAPVFSASLWPGAMPLPVLYLPQSLCCSQFSQHASRSADDTVSAAVVFMLQHLDTSGAHLNTIQFEY